MTQTFDEDGMLLPGPSESRPSNVDANEDRLLKSDGEFESGQRSPIASATKGRTASPTKELAVTDTAPQLWKRKFKVPSCQSKNSRCMPRRKRAPKT